MAIRDNGLIKMNEKAFGAVSGLFLTCVAEFVRFLEILVVFFKAAGTALIFLALTMHSTILRLPHSFDTAASNTLDSSKSQNTKGLNCSTLRPRVWRTFGVFFSFPPVERQERAFPTLKDNSLSPKLGQNSRSQRRGQGRCSFWRSSFGGKTADWVDIQK